MHSPLVKRTRAHARVKAPLLGLFLVFAGLSSVGLSLVGPRAQAATADTYLNFQARLLTSGGAVVADGNYNIDFKIYNADSTTGSVGTCSGSCLWEETRKNSNSQGVKVVDGYFSANLGSVTAFSGINWDQQLWLTMNIGGTSTGASPTWDGEMQNGGHSIAITSVPLAFRANALANVVGGNEQQLQFASSYTQATTITLPDPGASTATVCYQNATACGFAPSTGGSGYVQLQGSSPGTQQTGNFNISGVGIAGTSLQAPVFTGSAGIAIRPGSNSATGVQIQNAAGSSTILDVDTSSSRIGINTTAPSADLTFGEGADRTINVLTRTTNAAGNALTVAAGTAGSGTTGVAGGNLTLQAGSAAGTTGNANGGDVIVKAGAKVNSGTAGAVKLQSDNGVYFQDASGNNYLQFVDSTSTLTCGIFTTSSTNACSIYAGGNLTIGAGGGSQPTGYTTAIENKVNSPNMFQVQNSSGAMLLNVDGATNSGTRNALANTASNFAGSGFDYTSGSTAGWAAKGSAAVTLSHTNTAAQLYSGTGSLVVTATSSAAAGDGAKLNITLSDSTQYTLTFYAKLSSGTMTTLAAGYSSDGSTDTNCTLNSTTLSTSQWNRYTCTFTTASSHSGTPFLYIKQTDASTAHTYYLDSIFLEQGSTTYETNYVTNSSFEINTTTGWSALGSATIAADAAQQLYGSYSMRDTTTASTSDGAKYAVNMVPSAPYTFTFWAKTYTGSFTLNFGHADNGSQSSCGSGTVTTTWTQFTCNFTTGSTIGSSSYVYMTQASATARTFFVDGASLDYGSTNFGYHDTQVQLAGPITSPTIFRSTNDISAAFQIQSSEGSTLLNADTANLRIAITGGTTINAVSNTPTITHVQESDFSTSLGAASTTFSLNPASKGNLILFGIYIVTRTASITSMSGGGVSNWHQVTAYNEPTSGDREELWEGTVTSTGSSTLTVNFASSATAIEGAIDEFSSGQDAATDWKVDTSGALENIPSSGTDVTFPAMTATSNNELYWSFADLQNAYNNPSGSCGSGGYVCETTASNNGIIYNTNISAGVLNAPTATQTGITANSYTIGALVQAVPAQLVVNAPQRVQTLGYNSLGAFQIQNASGATLFNADTVNGQITIASNNNSTSVPQLLIKQNGGAPVISHVNGWSNNGNGVHTLSVSPSNVGDLMVFATLAGAADGGRLASVSGGGVTNWHLVKQVTTGAFHHDQEIWEGTVTSTGSSTITATFGTGTPVNGNGVVADEFTASTGAQTDWSVDTSGYVEYDVPLLTYPSLTASASNELYYGWVTNDGSASSAGSTSGFSYRAISGDHSVVAYNTDTTAGTTYEPSANVTGGTAQWAIAAIISAAGNASQQFTNSVGSFAQGIDPQGNYQLTNITNSQEIGYTSTNGDTDSGNDDALTGDKINSGSGGTVNSVSVYTPVVQSSPNNHMAVAIYDGDNAHDGPTYLVAKSASTVITAGWNTIPITAQLNPNSTYWVVFNVDGGSTQYGRSDGGFSIYTDTCNSGDTTYPDFCTEWDTVSTIGTEAYTLYLNMSSPTSLANPSFSVSPTGTISFNTGTQGNFYIQDSNDFLVQSGQYGENFLDFQSGELTVASDLTTHPQITLRNDGTTETTIRYANDGSWDRTYITGVPLWIQAGAFNDSTRTFEVQDSSENVLLNVDTTNTHINLVNTTISEQGAGSSFPHNSTTTDNFNRGSLGSNWTGPSVGDSSSLTISSNQVTSAGSGYGAAGWNATQYGPDEEVYVTVSTLPSSGDDLALYLRASTPSSGTFNGYMVALDASDQSEAIFRIDGGSYTKIGGDYGISFTAGDSFGMSAAGNTITAWYKHSGTWTAAGSAIDYSYDSAGYTLLEIGDNTARLDNFTTGNALGNALTVNGGATISTQTNDTNAFQVQNSSSSGIFNVDTNTNGGEVSVRISSTTATERLCSSITNGSTGLAVIRDCTGTPGDYAEDYGTTDPSIDAGDVVALDASKPATDYTDGNGYTGSKAWVVKASSNNAGQLLGVVSTSPNEVIGQVFSPSENPRPVSLNGRVPVKVNDQNGAIHAGDYLMPSDTPGVAMKADHSGWAIGVALSDFTGSGQGTVYVSTGRTWYAQLVNLQAGAQSVDSLDISGDLAVAGNASFTGNISIAGHIIGNNDTSGVIEVGSGDSSSTLHFNDSYAAAPSVVVTPESDPGSYYWVSKSTTSFTLHLASPASDSIKFDYQVQQ